MSKSVGNYIAVTDPPAGDRGIFGKVMSLPDDVMDSYYLLVTDIPGDDYRAIIRSNPRDAKVRLAREIISWLHSPAAAEDAEAAFRRQFVEKQVPTDMPETAVGPGPHRLTVLLVKAGLATSNGEATRKVKEGAVDVDQQRVTEFNKEYLVERPMVLRLGRRFARVLP
jgi:tyrosyl-tRNA synthetase